MLDPVGCKVQVLWRAVVGGKNVGEKMEVSTSRLHTKHRSQQHTDGYDHALFQWTRPRDIASIVDIHAKIVPNMMWIQSPFHVLQESAEWCVREEWLLSRQKEATSVISINASYMN